jgi:hypothetical protein
MINDITPSEVLYLIMTEQVNDVELTPAQILDAELLVMDTIAIKVAGAEHLVHWESSQEYH